MNKSNDLTVITAVENDCGGILDLMVQSIHKFTNPIPKIILCNQGKKNIDSYLKYTNLTIVNHSPSISGGSNRHGCALNKVLPMVTTKRTAIVESDCIVLCDGWDSSGGKRVLAAKKAEKKDKILYHVCFMVFETEMLKNVDFRPGTDKTRVSGRPYNLWEDVGWRVDEKIKPKDVGLLTFIDCKAGNGQYFGSNFQSDEFWFNGKAVVAHFGRGSNISGKAIRKNFKHPKEQLEEWKKIAEEALK